MPNLRIVDILTETGLRRCTVCSSAVEDSRKLEGGLGGGGGEGVYGSK